VGDPGFAIPRGSWEESSAAIGSGGRAAGAAGFTASLILVTFRSTLLTGFGGVARATGVSETETLAGTFSGVGGRAESGGAERRRGSDVRGETAFRTIVTVSVDGWRRSRELLRPVSRLKSRR
jgi:hypothetical protein